MENITKKIVSVEFEGKRYVLPDDATIGMILVQLGLPEDSMVDVKISKEGFLIIPKINKNWSSVACYWYLFMHGGDLIDKD